MIFTKSSLFLETLTNITFDWNSLITDVSVYTTDKDFPSIDGDNITWDPMPQYPSCQGFDPADYFDFDASTPLQIFIDVAKVENMGVSFYFEDKNKALRRKQKSNMLAYSGPAFQNLDLNHPTKMRGIFKISQSISSEEETNKKCRNYPNKNYKSYQECDEQYLQDIFKKKFKIMPPWVATDLDQVSDLV